MGRGHGAVGERRVPRPHHPRARRRGRGGPPRVAGALADRGIELAVGIAGVDRIERAGDGATGGLRVAWRDADGAARATAADEVVLAVGWAGSTGGLDLDRAGVGTAGFCKLVAERDGHRVVGAHVVGGQAVEVVQLVAAGMAAGMRVDQLADVELAYPTFTSIVGLCARRLARDLGVVPVSPHWRALGGGGLAEWERRAAP
jgi:hypothetical protein